MKVRACIIPICSLLFLAGCKEGSTSPDEHERSPEADLYDPNIADNYSAIAHISDFEKWGHYNVHDPSLIKHGGFYYLYSTDVFYGGGGVEQTDPQMAPKITIRRSTNLVDWQPIGHVFDEMPEEVVRFLREIEPSYYPVSVWAPYIFKHGDEFRLYYSVPANNMHTAYLGLAVSDHPEGPWENKGLVLPTYQNSPYNGIDPAIIENQQTGEQWMMYGSWTVGIFAVQLNPETGFRLNENDIGHVIAARPYSGLEGGEVIYHPEQDKYYLFVSYDPLIEIYNVRVGRADSPEGPYLDIFGNDMADAGTDNLPRITAQYKFDGHPGWQGLGHTGLIREGNQFYMANQGRYGSSEPLIHLMVLHVRKLFWTDDGWPTASPERYAGVPQVEISDETIIGEWEWITLTSQEYKNHSKSIVFNANGSIKENPDGRWSLTGDRLSITLSSSVSFDVIVSRGWDWENDDITFLFTGLNAQGVSEWGKKMLK